MGEKVTLKGVYWAGAGLGRAFNAQRYKDYMIEISFTVHIGQFNNINNNNQKTRNITNPFILSVKQSSVINLVYLSSV